MEVAGGAGGQGTAISVDQVGKIKRENSSSQVPLGQIHLFLVGKIRRACKYREVTLRVDRQFSLATILAFLSYVNPYIIPFV